MRDHSKHIQVTRDEAIRRLLGACDFHPGVETVPVDESYGRVLAEDAVAQEDMPNCLTCRMDSVAVHWYDFENGMPDTSQWVRGVDWEFANTGVGMPEGFDTVIVIEHCIVSDDDQHVSFDALPSGQYAGTTPAGSRMHAGDVLVSAGAVITPLLAAHIASGNNTEVRVLVKPKVAFIPSGNELVAPGSTIGRGKNVDSNSTLMKGKIESWGAEPIMFPIVPDDPESLSAALRKATEEADIVVLNAGSSKGSEDYSVEVLEQIGTVMYHQTNHGPGHHSFGAQLNNTPVVGISGPPGGAAFTTDFYLKPVIQKYLGQQTEPARVRVRLAEDFPAGGPGGGAKPAGKAPAAKAEERPREGGEFFGVRQMVLRVDENGLLEAAPLKSFHAGPVEAETASAYYMLKSGPDAQAPHAGDIIEVALRPEFKIAPEN